MCIRDSWYSTTTTTSSTSSPTIGRVHPGTARPSPSSVGPPRSTSTAPSTPAGSAPMGKAAGTPPSRKPSSPTSSSTSTASRTTLGTHQLLAPQETPASAPHHDNTPRHPEARQATPVVRITADGREARINSPVPPAVVAPPVSDDERHTRTSLVKALPPEVVSVSPARRGFPLPSLSL